MNLKFNKRKRKEKKNREGKEKEKEKVNKQVMLCNILWERAQI